MTPEHDMIRGEGRVGGPHRWVAVAQSRRACMTVLTLNNLFSAGVELHRHPVDGPVGEDWHAFGEPCGRGMARKQPDVVDTITPLAEYLHPRGKKENTMKPGGKKGHP